MSEQTKKLVPMKRFPEFQDAAEWEEMKLGQLGKLVSGLTYSPDDIRDSGLLVLRSSNVQNGEITLDDNVFVTSDIRGANLSKPNDILICVRNGSKALIGKNALIPEGMPLCTHGAFMTVFRSPTAKFVFQLFQTTAYQKQVDGDLGATINSINGSQFIKYKFYVPKPLEQQKIADCLSSIDELITAQTQKITALKDHKKGLMQQLFPAEGENIPKLRFPEFQSEADWINLKLGEVLGSESSTIAQNKQHFQKSGYPIYGADGLIGYIASYEQFEDYIAIIKDGSGVGRLSLYKKESSILGTLAYLKIKSVERYSLNWVFYLLQTINLSKYIKGSGIPHIYYKDYAGEFIRIPTLTEQQKIADCLSSIDELIKAQTQQLEFYKTQKKGLMQQLFPSLNEVSE